MVAGARSWNQRCPEADSRNLPRFETGRVLLRVRRSRHSAQRLQSPCHRSLAEQVASHGLALSEFDIDAWILIHPMDPAIEPFA